MSQSILDQQAQLPRRIPLYRYAPERSNFLWNGWNPLDVKTVGDLPEYLILGPIDPTSFEISTTGWSAVWRGFDNDSSFTVAFNRQDLKWDIRQVWRGIFGGSCTYSGQAPLNYTIASVLYTRFPQEWENVAKSVIEANYQITVIEQGQDQYSFCGIPDGPFRTILFPIRVQNLRSFQSWIKSLIEIYRPDYPIYVEAQLMLQAINYLEDKAPDWTCNNGALFAYSLEESDLAPNGLPVREVAADGSAAWTLRRDIYFVVVHLPFTGLTDFVAKLALPEGPLRSLSDQKLRIERKPIIFPAGFEVQTESIALWDDAYTTRSFIQFPSFKSEGASLDVSQFCALEGDSDDLLAMAEHISGKVTDSVKQIMNKI